MNSSQNVYSRGRGRNRNDHIASATSWNSENTTNRQTKNKVSDDEEGGYAVNLRLSAVTHGVVCHVNDPYHTYTLKGYHTFNHYFKLLDPIHGGTFPDVWSGYYHITLGKFKLNYKQNFGTLQAIENELSTKLNELERETKISKSLPQIFSTDELYIHPGQYRLDDRKDTNFVVFKVTPKSDDFSNRFISIMKQIRQTVLDVGGEWERAKTIEDYVRQLHVTIRKYPTSDFTADPYWTQQQILANAGVLRRLVHDNPLEFECQALDVCQSRRQGIARRQNDLNYQWWSGVTEITKFSGKCTGCNFVNSNRKWDGWCSNCGEYEVNKPVWSTDEISVSPPIDSMLSALVTAPVTIAKPGRVTKMLSLDFIVPVDNESEPLDEDLTDTICSIEEHLSLQ
ncbi:unnamed protein product [Didymodactylos carnosus]|uniref:Uncharacterized protein n=1 Tax=Didymodactylos carnosus TaxID=1234261 RepID=A0A814BX08_9BILA|nr:unnamed protein product [Didymodactylos carnosus]CAF3711213.1 unnamed protein product [Didymodactylos carnosus]